MGTSILSRTYRSTAQKLASYGWTPLYYAVWEGHIKAVKVLFARGAKASGSLPDYHGSSLLHLSAGQKGQAEIVKDLLAAGSIDSINR